jgi:hypothetical protein
MAIIIKKIVKIIFNRDFTSINLTVEIEIIRKKPYEDRNIYLSDMERCNGTNRFDIGIKNIKNQLMAKNNFLSLKNVYIKKHKINRTIITSEISGFKFM